MAGSWEIVKARSERVLVATLNDSNQVSRYWTEAIRKLWLPLGSDFVTVSGFPFGPARNQAALQMMNQGYGYLFFLDSDTIPPPDAVQKLIAVGRDLVGGLYFQRFPPFKPAAFMKGVGKIKQPDGKEVDGIAKIDLPPFNWGDVIPVDFLPTGCTLVSRRCMESVLRVYPKPYEWTLDIDTTGGFSEDYNFCLKAQSLGFAPWLHTGVVCRHEIHMMVGRSGPEMP